MKQIAEIIIAVIAVRCYIIAWFMQGRIPRLGMARFPPSLMPDLIKREEETQ